VRDREGKGKTLSRSELSRITHTHSTAIASVCL